MVLATGDAWYMAGEARRRDMQRLDVHESQVVCVLCELGPAIAQVSISSGSMIEGSGPRASGDKWRS